MEMSTESLASTRPGQARFGLRTADRVPSFPLTRSSLKMAISPAAEHSCQPPSLQQTYLKYGAGFNELPLPSLL